MIKRKLLADISEWAKQKQRRYLDEKTRISLVGNEE